MNTGFEFGTNGPNRQHFGWVQFSVNNNLDIQIIDSAVNYYGSGIVVGRNQVPEPSSALVCLGLLGTMVIRRQRTVSLD